MIVRLIKSMLIPYLYRSFNHLRQSLPTQKALSSKRLHKTQFIFRFWFCSQAMSKFLLGEPQLFKYEGSTYNQDYDGKYFDMLRQHTFDPDDVIIAAYPRSGTSWMNTLVSLILSEGKSTKNVFHFMDVRHNPDNMPDFEVEIKKPPPHYFRSHLHYSCLEECFERSKPKVIYVMRNPLDQLVSFYHYHKMAKYLGLYTGSWDEFYNELYKKDKLCFGNYFEHVSGWWSAREKCSDHVLFVKYEDMHKNIRQVLENVLRFLDKTLSNSIKDIVVQKSSFDYMKSDVNVNRQNKTYVITDICPFLRSGQVGNWKRFVSDKQREEIETLYREKLVSQGLVLDFDLDNSD